MLIHLLCAFAIVVTRIRAQDLCVDGQWTAFFNHDDPTDFGDFETIVDLYETFPEDMCLEPTAIDARVASTNLGYETGGQNVTADIDIGFSCRKEDNSVDCLDYRVRFCCPKTVCHNNDWTPYFNIDNTSGLCDCETLDYLRIELPGKICRYPTEAEARLVSNQLPYTTAGQNVTINPFYGFSCYHSHQENNGSCEDYEVRFCCPLPPEPLCLHGEWTEYFNEDSSTVDGPDDKCDCESLSWLRETHPGAVCDHPTAIDVRVASNNAHYSTTGQHVSFSLRKGFQCNDDNNIDECLDYKVRYCCPIDDATRPLCPHGYWTRYFDRDDPTNGGGDYETLNMLRANNPETVCEKPIAIDIRRVQNQLSYLTAGQNVVDTLESGLICENIEQECEDYEVRFCCQYTCEERCSEGNWTIFFDIDDPADSTCDCEPFSDIRRKYPADLCHNPTDIDVRLLNGNDFTTADQVVDVNLTTGFTCNNDQNPEMCNDYKVRFCCIEIILCDDITTPANGAFVSELSANAVGQVVNFTCNVNYVLNGAETVECLENGEWSDVEPTCEVACNEGDWTTYFDEDNAGSTCDCEPLGYLREQYPGQICPIPLAIEAKVVGSNLDYTTTNQIVDIGPTLGFTCYHANQTNNEMCEDYKVRFCCPPVACNEGDWTIYFDEDNAGSTCDCEPLGYLREQYPGQICPIPSAIEARVVGSNLDYTTTNQIVDIGPTLGFTCYHADQTNNEMCEDYKVRFCCPPDTQCDALTTLDSGSINPDLPKNYIGQVVSFTCVQGYALNGVESIECLENGQWSADQPICELACNEGDWTIYFDEDNAGSTCDCEPLGYLREQYPGQICPIPSAIEARVVGSNLDYTATNQIVDIGPTLGFTCYHADQTNNEMCEDYKVRFCCPPDTQCDALTTLDSGSINPDLPKNYIGQVVSFTCVQGYALNGVESIECLENGQWSADQPICELIICENVTAPAQGSFVFSEYPYVALAYITFSCQDGYMLDGAITIQCQSTGEWTDVEPTCEGLVCGTNEENVCGTDCPASCLDPAPSQPCADECRCQCKGGYIRDDRNDGGNTCVEPRECLCIDDNEQVRGVTCEIWEGDEVNYFTSPDFCFRSNCTGCIILVKEGDTALLETCTQECTCLNNQFTQCVPHTCSGSCYGSFCVG